MKISKLIKRTVLAVFALGVSLIVPLSSAYAYDGTGKAGITVSPMYQFKVLTAGESEPGSFIVANPADNTGSSAYELYIRPFSYDDKEGEVFAETEAHSDMVDWIHFDGETTGTLEPNESREVSFTIDVPEGVPAGGQYAAIIVKSSAGNVGPFAESIEIAHLIYAEVSGETKHSGTIDSLNVPGFLFSGNISGNATIHNTGNSHAYAVHTFKVLPLFGNEEFFTNEEDPQKSLIIPDATRYTSVEWKETPSIGIFRVQYTVEFEGVKREVSKIVIVCPLWLLIIIALIVLILIYRIFAGHKSKK